MDTSYTYSFILPSVLSSLNFCFWLGETSNKYINQHTPNSDVRLFVYNLVRRYDEDIDEHTAWAIARKVIGDGEAVLRFKKEKWVELLDGWGDLIYDKIESQKYVDVSEISVTLIATLIVFSYRQIRYGPTSELFNHYFWS